MEEGSRYMFFDRFGLFTVDGLEAIQKDDIQYLLRSCRVLQWLPSSSYQRLIFTEGSWLGNGSHAPPFFLWKAELFSSLEFEQVKKTWLQNRSFPGAANTAVLEESLETALKMCLMSVAKLSTKKSQRVYPVHRLDTLHVCWAVGFDYGAYFGLFSPIWTLKQGILRSRPKVPRCESWSNVEYDRLNHFRGTQMQNSRETARH